MFVLEFLEEFKLKTWTIITPFHHTWYREHSNRDSNCCPLQTILIIFMAKIDSAHTRQSKIFQNFSFLEHIRKVRGNNSLKFVLQYIQIHYFLYKCLMGCPCTVHSAHPSMGIYILRCCQACFAIIARAQSHTHSLYILFMVFAAYPPPSPPPSGFR